MVAPVRPRPAAGSAAVTRSNAVKPSRLGGRLYEFLLAAVVLGVWHAILVRLGRVPGWARSGIRVALSLVIVSEVTRFVLMESLPWRTRGVPLGELQHAVNQSMGWSMWLDGASLGLLGLLGLTLLALSLLRAVKGPPDLPPLVAADPPTEP